MWSRCGPLAAFLLWSGPVFVVPLWVACGPDSFSLVVLCGSLVGRLCPDSLVIQAPALAPRLLEVAL